ncbi:Phosphodiesterase I [Purpureocillium takamizusanense]|uniref:Fanconi-associated nuclease n=1 Tax=Purpureocillium takamizusanense TaxID=2060973 RepID=A0A9Q8Q7Q4_9HYPO|nr:Phosphodiesterase I [Purpureocillium takamizusanense]UNI14625.1 Phosphodiesterase I [Purpureocillium takamizusanense]
MDAFVRRLPGVEKEKGNVPVASGESCLDRPAKRQKRRDEIKDSASEGSGEFSTEEDTRAQAEVREELGGDDEFARNSRATDVENVLPPTETDDTAIEEYELLKSSQMSSGAEADEAIGTTRPLWIKGRSSIYVDAFNLALDTVLEEESQLFDSKELAVFSQWKTLGYEAQYLYVRLFLRKTAAWHRTSRLGYYADVSDPETAIESLQNPRMLPQSDATDAHDLIPGLDLEDFSLGETYTFADSSQEQLTSVEEAASLLYLDELKALAKSAKVQGHNKADFIKGLCRMSQNQAGLMSLGLNRHTSGDSNASEDSDSVKALDRKQVRREDSNREQHFLNKILDILGPCIRLSPLVFKLFERVHLVFYRSTEWTEKSLTTIILAKIARRNFPEYIVCRTSTIFASRDHLLEFEAAIRLEAEVDNILEFNGPPTEAGFQRIIDIFDKVYPRWQAYVVEEHDKERTVYEMGEGAYLRRFNPAHSYTRIILKAMYVLGRRKEHTREYELLNELLDQRLFHLARRGAWYQRKALLEEHYMAQLDDNGASKSADHLKRHWKHIAVATCEAGLQDPDCHLIHHYDLQKRLVKLEKKLHIPRRLQHDFGHVRLAEPIDITVEGIQLKRDVAPKPGALAASTKTIWLDELDTDGECSVEDMCLSHFRAEGWKGYHAEGGIIRTLFAYLFYDILFLYIPNVFQTAYQTCPLDLHTDAFFPARASEINHRLVEIANGEGERLLRDVWEREHEKRTATVGLNWDFAVEDMAELVRCFEGSALAAICKVMAQEYKHRGGGVPDLLLWRPADGRAIDNHGGESTPRLSRGKSLLRDTAPGAPRGEVMFAEVKSANDRLSDTQRLWIHVLTGAGVKVALCNAVAKEVRDVV